MSQYFKISKENSIRYSKVRLDSELKNDENTLSCESLNEFAYKDIQKYLTTDVITTQFRSAYATNEAKITDENGVDTSLTVTKKTTNKGRQKRYDGHYYNYKSDDVYTGIYFTTGNEYTYGTSTIIATHTFNGDLPEFGIIGQSVEIIGVGTYTIDRIVYDEDVDANVILVTRTHTGAEVDAQIQSQYDIEEYEVYEFDADFSSFLNEVYITVTVSEDYKRTLSQKSEVIDVQTTHPNTIEIIYYNDDNGGVMYSTGIQNKIRPAYYFVVAVPENDNDVNLTDTTSILIDSNIYGKNKFTLKETSNEIMLKHKMAFSSDNVIINEEGYTIGGSFGVENYENTNLYILDVIMNKTGVNHYTDITLDAALAYKARVEALSGVIDSWSCLINDYDNNY